MANYWIKLYIEILNDSKMAVLPDRLWRRAIEMFLAAGQYNDGGHLPDTSQLAWLLRADTDELELDLRQLASTGIITRTDRGWLVTKFAQRQAPVPGKERVQQFRDRQKKQQYYGDVTELKRDVTQIQITDKDVTETETEQKQNVTPSSPVWLPSADAIFCKATGMAAFPGGQLQYIAIVEAMRETFGVERTVETMKRHYQKWRSTPRKTGNGNYSGLNLTWIDRAQEELAGSPEVAVPDINDDPAAYSRYLAEKYREET